MILARDVMTKDLITIPVDMTVEEAIQALLMHGISGAPVVDESGKLVGIVSEFQLLEVVYDAKAKRKPVSDYMTTEVISVSLDSPLTEVANRLIAHRIRRLPVLDNGKLVGLISRPDLLRYVVDAAAPVDHVPTLLAGAR
jgi:CBS domain-containing protein